MEEKKQAEIGVYGLSVMGGNLARNFAGKGFRTAVYTRSPDRLRMFAKTYADHEPDLIPCETPALFCRALTRPRKILIMVKAGSAVDSVIDTLRPFLERGDILIDGGNSHYTDTKRRAETLDSFGIRFVGMGVSGGEAGALNGPSLMPGTTPELWTLLQPYLTAISAKAPDGSPCCASMGNPEAGHFVKMVHNGIEYADMQLISEAWMLLKHLPGTLDIPSVFRQWNAAELESYLIGITADILEKTDPVTGQPLVEMILDKAGQKGTGLWTSYASLDLGVPAPGITESVYARMISNFKEKRVLAAQKLPSGMLIPLQGISPEDVGNALYAAKLCSYSQGFQMFFAANDQFEWTLNPAEIAAIWRGGCIIRAAFLDDLAKAFQENPEEEHLILFPQFSNHLSRCIESWRNVVASAVRAGLPLPVFSAQLAWYDSMRSSRLPANLIQAQRDYFGAHFYERTDHPGQTFHTDWV